ncbi:MAG: cupin domain-containing protein [Dysgonamonadaceae bacterium]|jgi:transcriptional regulator with XRE-family HTH domain|nr:cupin domain-containing protein [Dysgonamonadaceae bacterium]
MNDQIRQIAERLKGLRESLDLSTEEMAMHCGKQASEVELYESGELDIPMSYLFDVAQNLGVDTSTLISGEEPRMKSYFLTRKGKGISVERTKAYKYRALAGGFKNPGSEPFEVTVEPNENPIFQNTHVGQEFNYVLEGRLQLRINDKDLILGEGDCIYFDSSNPHGMKALDGKPVKFLAIIM